MSTVLSRGTIRLDIESCKGCELCIPACPPDVLSMSEARNELGVQYPLLRPGCTGCGACALLCPDFCIDVYRYENPTEYEVPANGQEGASL